MISSPNKNSRAVRKNVLCNIVLIAGFLGAGKTTLLKNILKWPGDLSRTAILVNEFGSIGIDGAILKAFDTPVIELTNGCICCTMQGDLLKTIQKIIDGYHAERLFIEATGVADPSEILSALHSSKLKTQVGSIKVVTVLNADLWPGREYFGPLFYNQIKSADLLLFNKIDLLQEDEISQCLQEIRKINSACALLPTYHCRIDPEVFWTPMLQPEKKLDHFQTMGHPDGKTADKIGFTTFVFESDRPLKTDCFRRFLNEKPDELYRIKGFVLLDDKRFLVNHAGGHTEWIELAQNGPTKLAFVGWRVSASQFLEKLKLCLVRDSK